MVDVPFPKSTTPGEFVGEGQGRLVNCYVSKEGDLVYWRRMPGLASFCAIPEGGRIRGRIRSGPFVYVVIGTKCYQVDVNGVFTELYGDVPGTKNVTVTQNNEPEPRIVIVSEYTAQVINGLVLSIYASPYLPLVNSVTSLDGYILFTTRFGEIWATDLNSLNVNALSFAKAQSDRDGLYRGIVSNGIFYAMGLNTITPYTDAGTAPFPLQRATTVMSIGLAGPNAVAGDQYEWDKPPIFVATDDTVRILQGYETQIVSTPDIQRKIAAVTDKTTLEACVFDFDGNSIWSLSSATWTENYNVTTGAWLDRESFNIDLWRARLSVFAFGRWLFGDTKSSIIMQMGQGYAKEVGEPLVWGADSAAVKQFPLRTQISSVSLDFVLGQGNEQGEDPIQTAPQVMISWSHDGGATWSNPIQRPLNREGKFVGPIRVHRLGITTHHGFRLRWRISDPVNVSFMGATIEGTPRRA